MGFLNAFDLNVIILNLLYERINHKVQLNLANSNSEDHHEISNSRGFRTGEI